MSNPVFALRLSCLGIASCLLSAMAMAQSQRLPDCKVGPALPSGPISKSVSDCYVRHAQFLNQDRCLGSSDCAAKNAPIQQAYRQAENVFGLYLTGRDMESGRPGKAQRASDAFWSGFLQERSGYVSSALENYTDCTLLAKASEPPDEKDQLNCAEGLLRLTCLGHSAPAFCRPAPGPQAINTYTITTRKRGGGIAASSASADDGSEPERPIETESTTVSVTPPTQQELDILNGSLTAQQKLQLQKAIQQNDLTITTNPER